MKQIGLGILSAALLFGCGDDNGTVDAGAGGDSTAETGDTATDDTGTDDTGTDDTGTDDTDTGEVVTLTRIEEEVFAPRCAFSVCHTDAKLAGQLSLEGDSHAKIVGVPSVQDPSINLVEPGDPDASWLYIKCQPNPPVKDAMPVGDGSGLDSDRLELLRLWIAGGALDD